MAHYWMQFCQQPLPLPETRWFNLNVRNLGLITRHSVSRWQDKRQEDKGCLQAREMVVSGEFVRGPGEATVSIKPQVREMTAQGKGWHCVDYEGPNWTKLCDHA